MLFMYYSIWFTGRFFLSPTHIFVPNVYFFRSCVVGCCCCCLYCWRLVSFHWRINNKLMKWLNGIARVLFTKQLSWAVVVAQTPRRKMLSSCKETVRHLHKIELVCCCCCCFFSVVDSMSESAFEMCVFILYVNALHSIFTFSSSSPPLKIVQMVFVLVGCYFKRYSWFFPLLSMLLSCVKTK